MEPFCYHVLAFRKEDKEVSLSHTPVYMGLGVEFGFPLALDFRQIYSLSRSQAAAALREYLRKRGEEPISLEPLSRAEGETNTDAIVRTSKALYVMELKSTAHVCVDF